jgi:hypothetical protein
LSRLASLVLALAVLVMSGCGGTSGPVTHVSAEGVQADLPGEGWTGTGVAENEGIRSETWRDPAGTMIFRISTYPDEEFNILLSREWVERYMDAMYPWAAEATPAMLRGRNAYRMLAVSPAPDEFTMAEYAVIYKGRHYFIGAGATNTRWNNGGQDTVEDLLTTVKLEEPATPEP